MSTGFPFGFGSPLFWLQYAGYLKALEAAKAKAPPKALPTAQCIDPNNCAALDNLNGARGMTVGAVPNGSVVQVVLRQGGYALVIVDAGVATLNGGRTHLWVAEAGLGPVMGAPTPTPTPSPSPPAGPYMPPVEVQTRPPGDVARAPTGMGGSTAQCAAPAGCHARADQGGAPGITVGVVPNGAIVNVLKLQGGFAQVSVDATVAAMNDNNALLWVPAASLQAITAVSATGQLVRTRPPVSVSPSVDIQSRALDDVIALPLGEQYGYCADPGGCFVYYDLSYTTGFTKTDIRIPAGAIVRISNLDTFKGRQMAPPGYVHIAFDYCYVPQGASPRHELAYIGSNMSRPDVQPELVFQNGRLVDLNPNRGGSWFDRQSSCSHLVGWLPAASVRFLNGKVPSGAEWVTSEPRPTVETRPPVRVSPPVAFQTRPPPFVTATGQAIFQQQGVRLNPRSAVLSPGGSVQLGFARCKNPDGCRDPMSCDVAYAPFGSVVEVLRIEGTRVLVRHPGSVMMGTGEPAPGVWLALSDLETVEGPGAAQRPPGPPPIGRTRRPMFQQRPPPFVTVTGYHRYR